MGRYANFYNSQNGDRVYDADSFSEWLKPFFKNGVFNGGLQVTSNNDMTVNISGGYAYIDGKNKFFDTTTTLNIESAHATLKRIDSVVVRRDDSKRDFSLQVIKGAFSATPFPPQPIRSSGIYDLVLAYVSVDNATISITATNILDTRANDELCGWVVSTVQNISIEQLATQFNETLNIKSQEFQTWFNNIKNTLNSNATANLSNQLSNVDNRLITAENKVNTLVNKVVTATSSNLGLVKAGNTLKISSNGTLDVDRIVKTITLNRTNWNSNKVYTISDSLITATSIQSILPVQLNNPPTTQEAEYMKTLAKMNLAVVGQDTGYINICCLGTLPTGDINIQVIFEK